MRCIEIHPRKKQMNSFARLTLTWDVLKLTCWEKELLRILRLTLTWDVLKFKRVDEENNLPERININMRCIEINI